MKYQNILGLNAYLKFVEFVLGSFDQASDDKTVGEIRTEFQQKFLHSPLPFMSQQFGLIRLVPLMYMAEEKFLAGSPDGDIIRAMRNAFAHNNVEYDENGYTFKPNRAGAQPVNLSYSEIVSFIHRVENAFYAQQSR